MYCMAHQARALRYTPVVWVEGGNASAATCSTCKLSVLLRNTTH